MNYTVLEDKLSSLAWHVEKLRGWITRTHNAELRLGAFLDEDRLQKVINTNDDKLWHKHLKAILAAMREVSEQQFVLVEYDDGSVESTQDMVAILNRKTNKLCKNDKLVCMYDRSEVPTFIKQFVQRERESTSCAPFFSASFNM